MNKNAAVGFEPGTLKSKTPDSNHWANHPLCSLILCVVFVNINIGISLELTFNYLEAIPAFRNVNKG